ncbi:secernin-1-like protein, partial [Dinothrombium tinctorium]
IETEMESCDTFVVFPPCTANSVVIFGKNSDRPRGEVQEVVYEPRAEHKTGEKLECTFIEIDQVDVTHSVILSKPSWMWGAEMGANEFGVVIGNEAVMTKVELDTEESLLGMDLVRLGLERGKNAREALDVITQLLEKNGQGGACEESQNPIMYHNSFIIADVSEAWVLETAGRLWAAERVVSRFRNISNCLSIGTKIDLMSEGLKEEAKKLNLWDESESFHFANVFTEEVEKLPKHRARFAAGTCLLEKFSKENFFDIYAMINTLSDEESNICRRLTAEFPSAGSQISILKKDGRNVHWFNGTPDPKRSLYKPFVFTQNARLTSKIRSPSINSSDDPAKAKPRFMKAIDRRHELYKLFEACYTKICEAEESGDIYGEKRSEVQRDLIEKVEKMDFGRIGSELFNEAVEAEIHFYKNLI